MNLWLKSLHRYNAFFLLFFFFFFFFFFFLIVVDVGFVLSSNSYPGTPFPKSTRIQPSLMPLRFLRRCCTDGPVMQFSSVVRSFISP